LDNRAIGVFDSGVGGLTVLREIIRAVPRESTIYFGDTERFPYGPRDLNEVKKLAFKITRFLYDKDIKLIVIACNTAAAAALEYVKKQYKDIPVIGVIEPGARTAAYSTRNKRVGVIATKGTVESGAYDKEIKKIDPKIKTFSIPAPMLVDFVEKGILEGSDLDKVICGYLEPLFKADIDVLIMGCTHFPLIEKQILNCSGDGIRVINSAVETAKDVKKILEEKRISAGKGNRPGRIFYETGTVSSFFEVGKMFLGSEIREVIRTRLDI
jgi:glutamate racemase